MVRARNGTVGRVLRHDRRDAVVVDLKQERKPQAALAEYELALTRTPARLRSYYGAPKAAEQIGDTTKTILYHQKTVALCPETSHRPEVRETQTAIARG